MIRVFMSLLNYKIIMCLTTLMPCAHDDGTGGADGASVSMHLEITHACYIR